MQKKNITSPEDYIILKMFCVFMEGAVFHIFITDLGLCSVRMRCSLYYSSTIVNS